LLDLGGLLILREQGEHRMRAGMYAEVELLGPSQSLEF